MKQSLLMEGEKKQQEIAKKLIRGTDKTASESKIEQAECGTKAEISSSVEALTLQESSLEERGDATKRKVELGAVQNPIKGRTAADINALLQDSPNSISAEQIKLRSEYLRSQRDKLLELKKAERAKQFALLTEATAAERPRTSKAARGAMEGHLPKPTNEDPIIAARRAIASKLKVEVVKPT
ncbi:hypothetical protein AB6A40_000689 [Gnathostoma spinigerum]|uniref:Uncharacterized protein n=1 Tax=Gnathostoma spinigerum TaxID=75299 RepID=A0ABD6ECE8_9BILA